MGRINDLPSGAGATGGASGSQPSRSRRVGREVRPVTLGQGPAAAADAASLRGRVRADAASGSRDLVITDASREQALKDLERNIERAVQQAFEKSKPPNFQQAWEALPEAMRNDVQFCTAVILDAPMMVQFFSESVLADEVLKDVMMGRFGAR